MTRPSAHAAALCVAAILVSTGCATSPAPSPTTTPATTPAAASPSVSTSATASATATAAPPANPADVESVDAIIGALYDVISGPAGQRRNWDRMRSLFIPGARLIPTGRGQDGSGRIQVLTVEDYVTRVGPRLEEMGFFERELARRTERYGNIVHAFSTYDSKRAASDPQPFARGINSIQLWHDGRRWWVVSIFWEGERPDNPIPARYLRSEPAPPG